MPEDKKISHDELSVDLMDYVTDKIDVSDQSDNILEYQWLLGINDSGDQIWVKFVCNSYGSFFSLRVHKTHIRMVHTTDDIKNIWNAIGFDLDANIKGGLDDPRQED